MIPSSRRILHVLPSLNEAYGGPLRLVLDLSARAQGARLSSQVIGIGPLAVKDNPFDASRIHAVPASRSSRYSFSTDLRPWLRRHLPEFDGVVIHGAWTYPGWAAATECVRGGVPYAYYPHGMLEKWAVRGQGFAKTAKKLAYWLWREGNISRRARCTFFTTERERKQEAFRIDSPKCILRPYGINPLVVPAEAPANLALLQPEGSRIALFLGRLHPKKNVDFLLEAWRAAGMQASWRLVIAGSGEPRYEALLRREADTLGLGAVQFTGFVAGLDKRYLLHRADWFLLPSRQENFGVAVLEAIEHGCAVAISDQVYLSESFRPESEVLPLRMEAWVEFFQSRLQDIEWRRSVSRGDHDYLLKTFHMERIVQEWTDTLLNLFPQKA